MASQILGRDHEIHELQRLLTSKKSEFLAIYVRRRVGKNFLICKFFKDKPLIFFNVTGAKDGSMTEL